MSNIQKGYLNRLLWQKAGFFGNKKVITIYNKIVMTEKDYGAIPAVIWPGHDPAHMDYYKFIIAQARDKNYLRFETFGGEFHGIILRKLLESLRIEHEATTDMYRQAFVKGEEYCLISAGKIDIDKGSRNGIIVKDHSDSELYSEVPKFCDEALERLKDIIPDWTFSIDLKDNI